MHATFENPNLAIGVSDFIYTLKDKSNLQLGTCESARAFISQLQASQQFEDDVTRNDYEVPVSAEGYLPVRIVRRVDSIGNLPILFFVHGGGWITGNAMIYDTLLRHLAKDSYSAVVFADYTYAPQVRFPTQLEELWAVLQHIIKNPDIYQVQSDKIVMAGDGTGATMAAVLTNYAHKHGLNINFQLLLYPILDANLSLDTYRLFDKGPWLTKAMTEWFWENYLPDISMRNQSMVSPLMIPENELKGLPDTLIITAENDVSRDDGETYARKLTEAGNNAVSVRFNGTIHDFLMLSDLSRTFPTQLAFRVIGGTLRQALYNDETYNGKAQDK